MSPPELTPRMPTLKALIVDDEPPARRKLQRFLKRGP